MPDQPIESPEAQRELRNAARDGDRVKRTAIKEAMQAGWAEQEANESNWLDQAAQADPGPEAAVRALYGVASRLVERVAEITGEEREHVLREVLRLS